MTYSDPFQTREDFLQFLQWIHHNGRHCPVPAAQRFPVTNYSPAGRRMEADSRRLWGLLPAAIGCRAAGARLPDWLSHALSTYARNLVRGCDPDHPDFWGIPSDYDQRFVESAVYGLAIHLFPDIFRKPLSAQSRTRVIQWLDYSHQREYPPNNWRFFRIFTTLGLFRLTENDPHAFSEPRKTWSRTLDADLAHLDSLYLGHGWYADGPDGFRDYYNPFGFHTYGLLLHHLRPDLPVLQRFRDRALQFLEVQGRLFDREGRAIPFGRSMTYRFAQAGLHAVCAALDLVRETTPGVPVWWTRAYLKDLLCKHFTWWCAHPVFTESGRLSVGYTYPNPVMTEEYNAHGSPDWGLKSLWMLALPAGHPFWSAPAAAPVPQPPDGVTAMPEFPGLLVRREQGRHAFLLQGGQLPVNKPEKWLPRHAESKYAKFAYSSQFGFAVTPAPMGRGNLGIDSTLVVSLDGDFWLTRARTHEVRVSADGVTAVWSPWPDREVHITTRLVPCGDGHLRIHRVQSERPFFMVEGGFACPFTDLTADNGPDQLISQADGLMLVHNQIHSGVRLLHQQIAYGLLRPATQTLSPGAHLCFPTARVPILEGEIPAGESHWVSAWYAGENPQGLAELPVPALHELETG